MIDMMYPPSIVSNFQPKLICSKERTADISLQRELIHFYMFPWMILVGGTLRKN